MFDPIKENIEKLFEGLRDPKTGKMKTWAERDKEVGSCGRCEFWIPLLNNRGVGHCQFDKSKLVGCLHLCKIQKFKLKANHEPNHPKPC